jgi:serine/threonine protein phosphatase PrpC
MNAVARTHQGFKRRHNEDRHLIVGLGPDGALLAVADGMGGEAAGDLAATMAIDHLASGKWSQEPDPAVLVGRFRAACDLIYARAQAAPSLIGMGTTLTAVWLAAERAAWAHVGDSRLYLWREGRLDRVTRDHTAVAAMVEQGTLSPAEAARHPARNMLLDCVGCGGCSPDSGVLTIRPGDLILLTTDGLHDHVPEGTVTDVLGRDDTLDQKLSALIKSALDAGGPDNVTVVGLETAVAPSAGGD